MQWMVVDLPAPFGPSRQKHSPTGRELLAVRAFHPSEHLLDCGLFPRQTSNSMLGRGDWTCYPSKHTNLTGPAD